MERNGWTVWNVWRAGPAGLAQSAGVASLADRSGQPHRPARPSDPASPARSADQPAGRPCPAGPVGPGGRPARSARAARPARPAQPVGKETVPFSSTHSKKKASSVPGRNLFRSMISVPFQNKTRKQISLSSYHLRWDYVAVGTSRALVCRPSVDTARIVHSCLSHAWKANNSTWLTFPSSPPTRPCLPPLH